MQSQVSLAYFFFLKVILRWKRRVTQNCPHFPNLISLWKAWDKTEWERPGMEVDRFPGQFVSPLWKAITHEFMLVLIYCSVYIAISSIQPGNHSPYMSWIFSGFFLNPGLWTFLYYWAQDQSTLEGQHHTHVWKVWEKSNQTGLLSSIGNFLSGPGNLTVWKVFGSDRNIVQTMAKMLRCKSVLEAKSPLYMSQCLVTCRGKWLEGSRLSWKTQASCWVLLKLNNLICIMKMIIVHFIRAS